MPLYAGTGKILYECTVITAGKLYTFPRKESSAQAPQGYYFNYYLEVYGDFWGEEF